MFPSTRINVSFVLSLIFLGDMGETKLNRGATSEDGISSSLRGIPILRLGLGLPWSSLNMGSIKRPWYAHLLVVSKVHGQEDRKCFTTLGP